MRIKLTPFVLALSAVSYNCLSTAPVNALEAGTTAVLAAPKGDFFLELDPSEHTVVLKEVENLLTTIENQWNDHNLEALMSHYADDYVNNDGLDKKAVSELTKDFWEQYPDAKSASKTKEIRVDGNYATVDSRDVASGTTAKEIPGINSKGELHSVSEGELYLRKFADGWKIIGDRIDYEKVKVAYGLAKQLESTFTAPEQVKAGRKYSAKLEVKLPNGLAAVGEITSQNLQYPSPQSIFPNSPPSEIWKPLDTNMIEKDGYVLERIMEANTTNHNELLMTTVGITNAARNSLVGLEFLTRRLNVVPATTESTEEAEAVASKDKANEAKTGNKTDKEKSEKEKTDKSSDIKRSGETTERNAKVQTQHKSRTQTRNKPKTRSGSSTSPSRSSSAASDAKSNASSSTNSGTNNGTSTNKSND